MLRKNIRSSVFVLLALAACTSKNNVKITGEIKEAENQKVYLEQLNVDQAVIIDSTKTDISPLKQQHPSPLSIM